MTGPAAAPRSALSVSGAVCLLLLWAAGQTTPGQASAGSLQPTPPAAHLPWPGGLAAHPHPTPLPGNPDAHHHPAAPASAHSPVPFAPFRAAGRQPCLGGHSAGVYACDGIDLLAHVALNNFSTNPAEASNLWGFVDLDDNREYAVIGLYNGTAVVDVTDPVSPREVGTLPAALSSWREIKIYQRYNSAEARWDAYAYVATEAAQGIQILDLSHLPDSVSLATTYTGISRSHTLFIANVDPATGAALPGLTPYLYLNGVDSHITEGGMRVLSLDDPLAPVLVGAWTEGYMHDIQVLSLTDARTGQCAAGHDPCEVVLGWRGSPGFSVVDFTDKAQPVTLSTLSYTGLGFAHSGWFSADLGYAFAMDELDEVNSSKPLSTVRVFDLSDLGQPAVAGSWTGPTAAIDHNGYTVGGHYYLSNYTRGLARLEVGDPVHPAQTAFFDTYPASDGASYHGAWGVYPFLPSGTLLVSDIEGGLFILAEQAVPAAPQNHYLPILFGG